MGGDLPAACSSGLCPASPVPPTHPEEIKAREEWGLAKGHPHFQDEQAGPGRIDRADLPPLNTY